MGGGLNFASEDLAWLKTLFCGRKDCLILTIVVMAI